jgi:hypothetical protein
MVADSAREADPARLSKRLQSRRDVHLIPEDIVPSITSPRLIPFDDLATRNRKFESISLQRGV